MASPTLTLQLSDKTLKKLRALAMLSGSTVDELEQEFAAYFDQMLSDNISAILSELDGKSVSQFPVRSAVDDGSNWQVRETALKERDVTEEVAASAATPEVEHSLSDDELPEQNKSLAEQAEDDDMQLPELNVQDAGEDAEKFLDVAMSTPAKRVADKPPMATYMGSQTRTASKMFNPQVRKARVSEYTGDEDSSF